MADQTIERKETTGAASDRLLEESILPTWLNQRAVSFWGFNYIWIGLAVVIVTFQYGANGVGAGYTLPTVLAVVWFATATLAILMTMTADIGTEHGLSFAVFLRAPFGTLGTHLPAISRGIVAACWFGIQTYLGALAINGIVEFLTGFAFWPLWYALFMVVQVVNVALGIRAVEKLAAFAAPAILAVSIWMYFNLAGVAETEGVNIWTFAGDTESITLVALFAANMAVWSALSVDIPNITRFVAAQPTKSFFRRNRNVLVAQFFTLPTTQALIAFIGAVSFIATGNWNPVEVIQGQATAFVLVVLLFMVILAQWSTNMAANAIPAALTFVNAAAPRLRYPWAVVLAGVVGTAVAPWALLDNLFLFLSYYGGFIGAIGGIMVCDYYVLRRRRLNVPDLYRTDGQFRYWKGINPAGIIAWFAAALLSLIWLDIAFLIGFPIAFVLYYVLMRFWILSRYRQAEIESGYDDRYLATSLDLNWVYHRGEGFTREKTEEIPETAVAREDL
ncbi:MAG: NCS1 family transporter [Rubrobacteraceae bacterium]